jgi:hypothetical protein
LRGPCVAITLTGPFSILAMSRAARASTIPRRPARPPGRCSAGVRCEGLTHPREADGP